MRMRTLNEAAGELGTTRDKLRRGIIAGRYPSMKWGNRTLVDVDVLRPLLDAEKGEGHMVRIQECAEQIGMSQGTLRRMANSGLVPCERRGAWFYFNPAEVQAAIEKRMTRRQK